MNRVIILVLLCFSTLAMYPQKGDIAPGIVLGNPIGITAQYRTGSETAVTASLGRQIASINHILLNADFLVYPWSFDSEGEQIRIYTGAGGIYLRFEHFPADPCRSRLLFPVTPAGNVC